MENIKKIFFPSSQTMSARKVHRHAKSMLAWPDFKGETSLSGDMVLSNVEEDRGENAHLLGH